MKTRRLEDRPLRVRLSCYGHYPVDLPVETVDDARLAMRRWQEGYGVSGKQLRFEHGVVFSKRGEQVAHVRAA